MIKEKKSKKNALEHPSKGYINIGKVWIIFSCYLKRTDGCSYCFSIRSIQRTCNNKISVETKKRLTTSSLKFPMIFSRRELFLFSYPFSFAFFCFVVDSWRSGLHSIYKKLHTITLLCCLLPYLILYFFLSLFPPDTHTS